MASPTGNYSSPNMYNTREYNSRTGTEKNPDFPSPIRIERNKFSTGKVENSWGKRIWGVVQWLPPICLFKAIKWCRSPKQPGVPKPTSKQTIQTLTEKVRELTNEKRNLEIELKMLKYRQNLRTDSQDQNTPQLAQRLHKVEDLSTSLQDEDHRLEQQLNQMENLLKDSQDQNTTQLEQIRTEKNILEQNLALIEFRSKLNEINNFIDQTVNEQTLSGIKGDQTAANKHQQQLLKEDLNLQSWEAFMLPFKQKETLNGQPRYDLFAAEKALRNVESRVPELAQYAAIRAAGEAKLAIINDYLNSIQQKKSFPGIAFMMLKLSQAVHKPHFTELLKNTPQENEKTVFKIKADIDLTFERFDEKAQNLLPKKRKNLTEEFNAMYKFYKDNQINSSYEKYYDQYDPKYNGE